MQVDASFLVGVVAVQTVVVAGVVVLIWRRTTRSDRPEAAPAVPAAHAPAPVPDVATVATMPDLPAPAAAPRPQRPPAAAAAVPAADDEEEVIEDGRAVPPTEITLVWGRINQAPERYGIVIDSVGRDCLVFGGVARRLDVIQVVATRRMFHTMRLPQERLLAAHDAQDQPIEDLRGWLGALPDASPNGD